ncbi:hypothetical protein ABT072_48220 [Streptomyces sp. NPDC002589]|uniref:hypothetical protein n=1 Tax=Streptomyces sp. NPDC002589 TaxID=3154420 RepID=UPI00332BFC3C
MTGMVVSELVLVHEHGHTAFRGVRERSELLPGGCWPDFAAFDGVQGAPQHGRQLAGVGRQQRLPSSPAAYEQCRV